VANYTLLPLYLPREIVTGTHGMGDSVDLKSGLEAKEKRKIFHN
jgi:hypothetical protein